MMKFTQNTHQKDKRNQMKITNINQEDKKLVQTTKTVDWLVNNTHVFVFDPVEFGPIGHHGKKGVIVKVDGPVDSLQLSF